MYRYGIVLFALVAGASLHADTIPNELQAMLEKAEQFELLSLSPDPRQKEGKDTFHDWKVLGKTTVKDADARKKLVAAFKKGVEENKGIAAKCFNPRHGIRVTHDGKTADFVICFECYQVKAFAGDQKSDFLITNSPQSAFDAVLKEAKVPLPEKPQK
jgi:hypothetical protein